MNEYLSKKTFNIEKTVLSQSVPCVIYENNEPHLLVRVYPTNKGYNYSENWCDGEYENVMGYITSAIRKLDLVDTYTVLAESMYLQDATMEYIDIYDEELGDISIAMYNPHPLTPHILSDGYNAYLKVTAREDEDVDECVNEALETLELDSKYKIIDVYDEELVEDVHGDIINIIGVHIEEVDESVE